MPRGFLKKAGIVAAVLFVAIQFLGPSPTNPPVEAGRALTTSEVFNRSCADCHSSTTRWPWYSHVAPASWLVVGHVDHARSHMNVSDWHSYTADEADHMLASMCRLSKNGKMPLPSYLWLHHDARLSTSDITALCEWAETQRRELAGRPEPAATREPAQPR